MAEFGVEQLTAVLAEDVIGQEAVKLVDYLVLPKLLADEAFRSRVTAGITDPVLRGFRAWYEELTDSSRSQVSSPLMNQLCAFLLQPFVRDAIAGGHSTVDMSQVLDGGICLVRIPKGSLGQKTTRLVGSLVVAGTWRATPDGRGHLNGNAGTPRFNGVIAAHQIPPSSPRPPSRYNPHDAIHAAAFLLRNEGVRRGGFN